LPEIRNLFDQAQRVRPLPTPWTREIKDGLNLADVFYAAQLFDPGACSAKPVHYLEEKQ
jgi:hypothetical protein